MPPTLHLPRLTLTPVRSWLGRAPVFWIILLATCLRLWNLGAECLWYDEAFTRWVALLDGPDFWQAIAGDVHPPLWYMVEWLTVRLFGQSEWALRLPALMCGVLAVYLVYRVGQLFGSERVARAAALIVAVLPGAGLYYSQEARMYSLLAVWLLLALWAALQRRWRLYVAVAGLAVYTHNLAVLSIFALGLVTLWYAVPDSFASAPWRLVSRRWREYRRWVFVPLFANLAVFALWLPWAAVMLAQMDQMGQGFWLWPLRHIGDLLWPVVYLTVGQRLPEGLLLLAYLVVFTLTLLSLVQAYRLGWLRTRRGLLLLAATVGGPLVAALASLLWRSVYLPRAFILTGFTLPLWWALALEGMSRPSRQTLEIILVVVLMAALAGYYALPLGRQDVRAFVQPVYEEWQSGDVIYHTNLTSAILTGYYTQDLPYRLWPQAGDLNQSLTDETIAAMGFALAEPMTLFNEFNRLWLVWPTNPMSTWPEQQATMDLLDHYPHRLVQTLYDNPLGRVALYEVWLSGG